ncbi:hypothetical protein STRDD13_01369 [Streptococcus sp. DD13]|nr:hypothetical protein STRDD13_01369 [Streptococcus sp. DD13]
MWLGLLAPFFRFLKAYPLFDTQQMENRKLLYPDRLAWLLAFWEFMV